MTKDNMRGQTVFITGGSRGLGKEIAKILVSRGAHVTIFARSPATLEQARNSIIAHRLDQRQEVNAVSVDLSDASKVESVFKSQPRTPDALYCVAGGSAAECGFMTQIQPSDLDTCMKNNYFTSAYAAQAVLKSWTASDDAPARETLNRKVRRIVFVNSVAALCPLPGYTAYAPAKCAVRALADTLRMEVLRYSNSAVTYKIHCAFPSNFISESFIEEQERKPALTKRIEGTTGAISELEKKFPSAEKMAGKILAGVQSGDFAVCDDSVESGLFWANMVGTSPKRGWGVVDSLYAFVVGLFVWPVLRRYFDSLCRADGE